MNTKIKIWIAVGIVFAFSIMVAEFFWLSGKNDKKENIINDNKVVEKINDEGAPGEISNDLALDSLDYSMNIATIDFVSPKAGEVWERGKEYTIQWSPEFANVASVQLLKNNVNVFRFDPPYENNSIKWVVPNGETIFGIPIFPGDDYKLRINSHSSVDVADDGMIIYGDTISYDMNMPFSIVNKSVKVLYPKGEEVLSTEKTYTIKWEVEKNDIGKINIFLDNYKTQGFYINDKPIDIQKGYFKWKIPAISELPEGGKHNSYYRIRIDNADDDSIYGESERGFSIVSSSELGKMYGSVFYDENGNGYHNVNENKWISSADYDCQNQVVAKGAKIVISYNTETGKKTSDEFPIKICGNQSVGIYSGPGIYFETKSYPVGLAITASMLVPDGWKLTSSNMTVESKIEGDGYLGDFSLSKK